MISRNSGPHNDGWDWYSIKIIAILKIGNITSLININYIE